MKFYCKPTLTLFLLLYVAIQSAQAQDTLRITLQDAVRIALSDNPTIKVAGQEILLKKEARREAYAGLFPEASLVGSYSRAIKKQSFAMMGEVIEVGTDNTYSGGLSVSLPVFAPALYKSISLTSTDVKPGGREITCFTSGYGKSSDQGIFSVAFGTGQL